MVTATDLDAIIDQANDDFDRAVDLLLACVSNTKLLAVDTLMRELHVGKTRAMNLVESLTGGQRPVLRRDGNRWVHSDPEAAERARIAKRNRAAGAHQAAPESVQAERAIERDGRRLAQIRERTYDLRTAAGWQRYADDSRLAYRVGRFAGERGDELPDAQRVNPALRRAFLGGWRRGRETAALPVLALDEGWAHAQATLTTKPGHLPPSASPAAALADARQEDVARWAAFLRLLQPGQTAVVPPEAGETRERAEAGLRAGAQEAGVAYELLDPEGLPSLRFRLLANGTGAGKSQPAAAAPLVPVGDGPPSRELVAARRLATEQLGRIRGHWSQFWRELRDFHVRERWKPLGYPSFAACCQAELGFGKRRAYELLDAARVMEALELPPPLEWAHGDAAGARGAGEGASSAEIRTPAALPPPRTPSQAQALVPILDRNGPEAMAAVWRETTEEAAAAGKPPTAARIQEVAKRHATPQPPAGEGSPVHTADPYTQGAQRHRDGHPRSANPYPPRYPSGSTFNYNEWHRGWDGAQAAGQAVTPPADAAPPEPDEDDEAMAADRARWAYELGDRAARMGVTENPFGRPGSDLALWTQWNDGYDAAKREASGPAPAPPPFEPPAQAPLASDPDTPAQRAYGAASYARPGEEPSAEAPLPESALAAEAAAAWAGNVAPRWVAPPRFERVPPVCEGEYDPVTCYVPACGGESAYTVDVELGPQRARLHLGACRRHGETMTTVVFTDYRKAPISPGKAGYQTEAAAR